MKSSVSGSSTTSDGSVRNHRAKQEYYDVLEMASSRLRQDNTTNTINDGGDEGYYSSGDEAIRKRKKKKKKKKESIKDDSYEHIADANRRSAIFNSFIPPSMMQSHGGMRKSFTTTTSTISKDYYGDDNDGETAYDITDPNDDLPTSRWNPASLVIAAQSRLSDGKIDTNGFYNNIIKERTTDLSVGKIVQTLVNGGVRRKDDQRKIDNDFNLHTIGTTISQTKKERSHAKLAKMESVIWADEESVLTNLNNDGNTIKVVDDEKDDIIHLAELNESHEEYRRNENHVMRLIWQRDRRRLGLIICAVSVVFLGVCLGLYLDFHDGLSSTLPYTNDITGRSAPPPRPLPAVPIKPIDGFDDSIGLHSITAAELQSIVNQITSDLSIMINPHSPQAKALEWSRNDIKIYPVSVTSRIVQRYALATLYYSTNGTYWKTNRNWGNGHECEWYGVVCDSDDNTTFHVTYMDLNSNNLVGTITPEIGWITTLEQIHLWGNKLVGSIPSTLSRLANLHTIYMDNNYLDGNIGDTFDLMRNLKHLDLSNNRLRGHIPHGLGSLSQMRDLRLSNNLLTSTFPLSLISLSKLETLLLDSNSLSGTLPLLVGEMKSLVTIRIHENDLKGTIPSFYDAKVLEEAHLDTNYFTGTIPKFGSERLREIYLGQNDLTGSIPDFIGDLTELEIFSANANKLNSTIPASISNATRLNILDLSHNKLTGEIPSEISNLVQLHEVRVEHNRLRGSVPDFAPLIHIKHIHLNNNLLSGKLQLSRDMGYLDNLREFTIQNNDLTGEMSDFICDLVLDVLTSDCWGDSPPVDCPCCTDCM